MSEEVLIGEIVDDHSIIEVAHGGADESYIDMIKRSLADEWAQDLNAGVTDFKRRVNIVGGKLSLNSSGVTNFKKLVSGLRIPVQLNGQDLIIGICVAGKILPHVTILGEFAIAVRDPRVLREINVGVEHEVSQGGMYVISRAELVYDNYGDGARFVGTDAAFLPSWDVFRDGAQGMLIGEIRDQIETDKASRKSISHHHFINHVRILQEVERAMNRARGFTTRSTETFALRRAFAHARGRLPITPMATNDLLDKITINNKAQLLTAALSFGLTLGDILEGLGIASMDEIDDDQAVVGQAWDTLINVYDLKRY